MQSVDLGAAFDAEYGADGVHYRKLVVKSASGLLHVPHSFKGFGKLARVAISLHDDQLISVPYYHEEYADLATLAVRKSARDFAHVPVNCDAYVKIALSGMPEPLIPGTYGSRRL